MQPKCSTIQTTSQSQSTSTSTASNYNNPGLLLPPERFKDVCLRPGGEQSKDVNSILEFLFDPDKKLNTPRNDVETLKHYLTSGMSFDTFKNKIKAYDNSLVCGLVWNINYVAYRCRTCALSPCMSICAECFKNGDHQGHDFNMFRSGAGGACDCGDECVMNPKGFCKSHGCNKQDKTNNQPPDELIKCCDIILSHLLYRILQYFRNAYAASNYNVTQSRLHLNTILNDILPYVEFLNELCSLGTPLRKILVDYMISEEFYQKKINTESKKCANLTSGSSNLYTTKLLEEPDGSLLSQQDELNTDLNSPTVSTDLTQAQMCSSSIITSTSTDNLAYQHEIYLKALGMQQPIKVPDIFKDKKDNICSLSHKNMIDEFLFWCIRFEFPESLVKYLLSLLPDVRYKMIFIKSFVSQYSYISLLLLNSKSEHLSSRVVHISVQLFSNEAIAIKALEECYLLPIILSTLYNMIVTQSSKDENSNQLLINSKLENEKTNKHLVVDPDHSILQENLYWLVISDLVNLLSHKKIALAFLNDADLVKLWLELISYFQTMNLNIRQFGEHLQQEQPTYFSSFSAELEFCSSIMWSFIQHLKNNNQLDLTINLLNNMLNKLRDWLVNIGLHNPNEKKLKLKRPNFKHLSFHIPLHRYYSSFLYNGLYIQSGSLDKLIKINSIEPSLLYDILAHPLQLQIGFHEIHANMWVRNGMQMRGQAMTFVQNHFCTSFNDADLFLIQILASKLDPNQFMKIFFERFHLFGYLKEVIEKRVNSIIGDDTNKKDIETKKNRDQAELLVSSDSIVASVVEQMLEGFEESSRSSSMQTNNSDDNYNQNADNLENNHQTAMLVGSLTVLAQIIMIKPNMKLKSYPLTRNELVYLLCVSDRTYSQIEENLPDICSLTSAKKFIKPILDDVSDFLQPTLDALSIGNLKQGRYKPKDKIWLHEYDPLYVMLRSVKRREFQESFDRYCQFVEKKLTSTSLSTTSRSAKSLWPPFRLPNRLNYDNLLKHPYVDNDYDSSKEIEDDFRTENELVSKWNILNTKVLHSIIITLLYEHYYTHPLSEKIIYFVIYILELTIYMCNNMKKDMKMEQETDSDVMSKEALVFDEFNYETWFKSNDISENLCTYVPFTKYEITQETVTETVDEDSSSSNTECPTHNKIPIPPHKKMCSGITSFLSKDYLCNQDSCSVDIISNGKKYKRTFNYESILSLLVKMVYKNKNGLFKPNEIIQESKMPRPFELDFMKNIKKPINDDPLSFKNTRIGDENDFIINILEEASKLNEKCKLNVEKTVETLDLLNRKPFILDITSTCILSTSPIASTVIDATTEDELKSKKMKAKARQQKLLAQMSSNQRAFLLNPNNKEDVEAFKESTLNISEPKSTLINTPSQIGVFGTSPDTSSQQMNIDTNKSDFKQTANESSKSITMLCTQPTQENIPEESSKEESNIYDCCICRLSSSATPDRPIGVVTLLQSTSVLGHRESIKNSKYIKKLPLNDETDYKSLITDTMCWKQEEKRIKNLCEAFSLDSCKYSINIGWKGGVYAQMCGHYLHFDCYSSYKQTLDEQTNQFTRSSNIEYACPLCRQIANCVLPVSPTMTQVKPYPSATTSTEASLSEETKSNLTYSTLPNTPAKLWILSSVADKMSTTSQSESQIEPLNLNIYDKILHLLKTRPFSSPDTNSKILTQCKNDALALITLTTPIEFRYIDHTSSISNPASYGLTSPVDDDIAMFTTSVLRTQLEIDLMLKLQRDENLMLNPVNFKKKRACFLPLFDVISTHCRLMCHELKPHVKQWLMLVNPELYNDVNKLLSCLGVRQNQDESIDKAIRDKFITKTQPVPLLLRDSVSTLLLIIVNLPNKVDKSIYSSVVNNLFNMVYIQAIIDLCREFDEEERETWSYQKSDDADDEGQIESRWFTFRDYVSNVINYLKNSNILNKQAINNNQQLAFSNYYIKTIWTTESAKNYVEQKCMHFLKIASLFKSYLYEEELPSASMNTFDFLIKYLNISLNNSMYYVSDYNKNLNDQSAMAIKTPLLKWPASKPGVIINYWLNDLTKANEIHKEQVENLLTLSFDEYHTPQLLELPHLYSDLFGYYLSKKCQFCSRVPKETGVCLICGAQVCYKTNYCCDLMREFNKKHVNSCGAGTFILININSTYVFVIRGKRCAPWASLYLDAHGEEDRDLRRGKPLYLNQQRYNLLKSSWCSHTFDYQSLKWYNSSLFIY